jgi:hypothetical protein
MRITGMSPGGVTLASGPLPPSGGYVSGREFTVVQGGAPRAPLVGTTEKNEHGEEIPVFTPTLKGLEEYNAFLKGYETTWFFYQAMDSTLTNKENKWHIMWPLIRYIYKLKAVHYGAYDTPESAQDPAGREGESEEREFAAWQWEVEAGSAPKLYVAWSPIPPHKWATGLWPTREPKYNGGFLHSEVLNPFIGLEPLKVETPFESGTLIDIPGLVGPYEIPVAWYTSGDLMRYVVFGNYTPATGDQAFIATASERKTMEEVAERIAEKSRSEQEEEAERRGEEVAKQFEEIAEGENLSPLGEEEVIIKQIYNWSGLVFKPGEIGKYGPFAKDKQARMKLEEKIRREYLGGAIPSGKLSKSVLKHLYLHQFSNMKKWALRYPLWDIPFIGKPPSEGYLVFLIRLEPGEFFFDQLYGGPAPPNALPGNEGSGEDIVELQKLVESGNSRIAPGPPSHGIALT